jgi:hypothetical protein
LRTLSLFIVAQDTHSGLSFLLVTRRSFCFPASYFVRVLHVFIPFFWRFILDNSYLHVGIATGMSH